MGTENMEEINDAPLYVSHDGFSATELRGFGEEIQAGFDAGLQAENDTVKRWADEYSFELHAVCNRYGVAAKRVYGLACEIIVVYHCKNRRLRHLAFYHHKKRVRKKNKHRIIREIKLYDKRQKNIHFRTEE